MLILKQPLLCRTLHTIGVISDHFSEKINWNYQIMSVRIEKEELLHLLSVPPEYYIEEHMNILKENYSNHTVMMQMLNNLINRILLQQKEHMTYQDSVYITTLLAKLGIRDVRSLIKQIREREEEAENLRLLSDIYQNRKSRLAQLFVWMEKDKKEDQDKKTETAPVLYLHQSVYERLKTAAIYYLSAEYARNQALEEYEITALEMKMAETRRIAQELTLHQIRSQISGKEAPLFLSHWEENWLAETEDSVWPVFNTTVLLHIAERFFTIKNQKWKRGLKNTIFLINALHQAGEHILNRIKVYEEYRPLFPYTKKERREIRQIYHSEIQTLGSLFYYMQDEEEKKVDWFNQQNVRMREKLSEMEKQTAISYASVIHWEKAKKDSLRILENPKEVWDEFQQKAAEREKAEIKKDEKRAELFSEETKAIYQAVLQQKNKTEKREEIKKKRETEIIYKKADFDLTQKQRIMSEQKKHTQIQNRQTEMEHYQIHTMQDTEKQTKTVQHNTDLTRLIQQGVKHQIGMITEQVYQKLEKKLANERKRRGF